MANTEQIERIMATVEKSKEETGFKDAHQRYKQLREAKDTYSQIREDISDLICEYIDQNVDKRKGRATIGDKYTVRDGEVKYYGQSSRASLKSLQNNVGLLVEAVGDDIAEIIERVPESFSNIEIKTKVLITEDDYDYDAVTMSLTGYSSGIKLVDTLNDGGSCGGKTIDFEKCCLDEITKIMRHLPFILEVIEDTEKKVGQRVKQMNELRNELENEVGE